MKRKFILQSAFITALGILLLNSGCATSERSPTTEAAGSKTRIVASELFNQNCAKCHGKDGRSKTFRGRLVGARNLADPEWQAAATDERMSDAIKKGPKAMPSFEKKLSQAEISALIAYVRLFKPLP